MNKELYVDIFRRLGMRSEGKAPQNSEPSRFLPVPTNEISIRGAVTS